MTKPKRTKISKVSAVDWCYRIGFGAVIFQRPEIIPVSERKILEHQLTQAVNRTLHDFQKARS